MLSVKILLAKILTWISEQGASSTGRIYYGTATSITPTRSGWLVVAAKTVSPAPTFAPVSRIFQAGSVVAEATGILYATGIFHCSCYVRKGTTYTIEVYRATLENSWLY